MADNAGPGSADLNHAGLDPALLEIIVCPQCHGDLAVVPTGSTGSTEETGEPVELICQGECGLAYPVRDGIPVLLVDEARPTH